jgi:MFS family permease
MTVTRTRTRLGAGYYRLWSASALSNVGDGVFLVVLPLLAAELTRSPALIAGVALAQRLPWLFFALPAGALADRLDRRRTMALVETMRFLVIGGLAVATALDVTSIPMLYVAALVLGVGETLFDTAAQSVITAVVAKDDLVKANGRLYAVEMTANQFIGPPLGGFLAGVATIGLTLGFGASAVLFAGAAVLLTLLRGSFRPERPEEAAGRSLWGDIVDGLRYLFGQRVLRTLAVMTGVQNLAFTAATSVLVLYAVGPDSPMGLSESTYGVLWAMTGVGAVVGSLVAAPIERWVGRTNVLTLSILTGTLFTAVPAVTAEFVPVAAAFALSSVGIIGWNVVTVSLRQRITPDHLLGRVNAGYRLLAWGSMPLGAAIGGLLAEAFGLRVVFAAASVAVLALLALRPVVSEANLRAAEGAPATAA